MNNLSKLGTQLVEIWKQLGVNQRVSVLAATLVLVAGLGSIAFWSSRTDYSLLYGKLSDTEASKVIAALDDAKVPYKIGEGGGSIMVPADKVYEMRMQLAGKGIPSGDGVGFEIFDKPNFGISDFVQRANYTRAIQGELARTISQADLLQNIKKTSSAWIKRQGRQYSAFFWQAGYGDFSIGWSQLEELVRYIERQEQHHRTLSFQEEYRNLLEKYRVEFDERYVWD